MIGDSLDDVHRELLRNWRYRFHYYRLWPYYTLMIWWIRFKAFGDRVFDLVDYESDEIEMVDELDLPRACGDCGRPLQAVRPGEWQCEWTECPSNTEPEECV